MKRTVLVAALLSGMAAFGGAHGPVGAAQSDWGYATDQYPGFDGLDKIDKPEKKDTSWFLSVSRDTPAEQLAYAKACEAEGSLRSARRGYDALVREWPASPEAPKAQLALAKVYETEGSYDDAFDEYLYLLDFYPRAVDYAATVEHAYKLANLMLKDKTTWLGISFVSSRQLRQNYENVVRRAPGADYVPQAYLRIASLREEDDHYEEAVSVYGGLMNRFPDSIEARAAAYLAANARMWLARRLGYNRPRLLDTKNYLRSVLRRMPDHERAEEMRGWLTEISDYLAEDDWKHAVFYDSNQRTKHSAYCAYEKFIERNPESSHVAEAKARMEELGATRPAETDAGKENGK